ncbi:uncharacterized protein LOC123504144 isoform X2 [Portunus trituberculatus]|uniref:uncharacterized protein LOC123504144 isoform X2 n=1 Tax=Portunus trituberculatus TaxID=210409 RepID=UPI001E1CDAC9|nr:uncharacterized protein LOC123504144 isoform X2 [Portunus trituberculatus]
MNLSVIPFLLLALILSDSAYSTCPESDQIHCGTSDRCTRIRYICDGDNDCGDGTDESSALCRVWRNNDCDRNLAQCNRLGRSDCVTISNYCTLTDPPCEGTLDMRLCVMLRNGKIQSLYSIELPTTTSSTTMAPTTHLPLHVMEEMWSNEFEEKLSQTISHPDCPQLYTRVGNQCLSVFFIGNMTWLESRAFCRAIGGDLFTLGKDLTSFTTLVQHLTLNGVTADFWIGGRFVNETAGWMWVDNTPLTMGSPFWAVRYNEDCSTRLTPYLNRTRPANDGTCYHYQQAPATLSTQHCVASTYQHYFYLTDENCFSKKSPLCVMPGEKKKQAH